MKYYYADAQNQPVGLFTLDEIKAKVAAGEIPPNPMVMPEGSAEWQPIAECQQPAAEAAAPSEPSEGPRPGERAKAFKSTYLGDAVMGALGWARRRLDPKLFGRCLGYARDYGHYVVLVGAALALIYAIYASIKFDTLQYLYLGVGSVAALAIAQFAAQRFLGAGDKLIEGAASRISTPAFLDCFALLALLLAVFAFFGGIAGAIRTEDATPALLGILTAVFCLFIGAIMLHPKLIAIEIGEGSAGEEAIGLMTLFLKTGLKLIPLFFFLFAVTGCLLIVFGFFNYGGALARMVPFTSYGTPPGLAGATLLVIACFVPLFGYLFFLLFYLVFDLIRAVLSLPGKLDALKR